MASLDCRQTPISIPQGFDLSGIPVDKATRLRLIAPKLPPTGPIAALPDGLNLNENNQIELHLSDSRKSASGYRYSLIDSRLTFPAIHNLTGGLPRAELCLYFRNQAQNLTSKIVCICLGLTIGMDDQAPYFTALSTSTLIPQRPLVTSLFETDDTFIEYVGADLRGRTLTTPNPSSKCDPVLQKVTYFVCVGQGFIGSQATLTRLIGLAGTGLIGPVKQTIKTLPSDLVKYASLVYGIRLGQGGEASGTAGTPTPTSALKCYRIDPSKDIKNGTINLNEPSDGTLADEVVASQISQDSALPAGATSGFQPGDAETYIAITVAVILGICLVLYLLNQFYPGGLGQFAGNTGLNTAGTVIAGGAGIAARAIGSGASTVGTAIGTGVRAAGSGIATGAGVAGTAIRSGASAAASGIASGARATSSAIGSGILGASTSIGRMGRGPIPFATSTSGPASGPMSASSAMHSLAASSGGIQGPLEEGAASSAMPPLGSAERNEADELNPFSLAQGGTATSGSSSAGASITAPTATSTASGAMPAPPTFGRGGITGAIAADVGTLASSATSGISAADSTIARGLDTAGAGLRTAGSGIARGTGAAASAAERGILGLGESFRRPRQGGIPFTTSSSSGAGGSSSAITAPPADNSNINPFYQPPPPNPTPPPTTAPSSGGGFSLSRFLGLGGTSVAPKEPEGNAHLNPFSSQYRDIEPAGSTGTSSASSASSTAPAPTTSSGLPSGAARSPAPSTTLSSVGAATVATSSSAAPPTSSAASSGATASGGGGFFSFLFGSNPPAKQSSAVTSGGGSNVTASTGRGGSNVTAATGGGGSNVTAATGGGGSNVTAATGGGGSNVTAATGGGGSNVIPATGRGGSNVIAATGRGGSNVTAATGRGGAIATAAPNAPPPGYTVPPDLTSAPQNVRDAHIRMYRAIISSERTNPENRALVETWRKAQPAPSEGGGSATAAPKPAAAKPTGWFSWLGGSPTQAAAAPSLYEGVLKENDENLLAYLIKERTNPDSTLTEHNREAAIAELTSRKGLTESSILPTNSNTLKDTREHKKLYEAIKQSEKRAAQTSAAVARLAASGAGAVGKGGGGGGGGGGGFREITQQYRADRQKLLENRITQIKKEQMKIRLTSAGELRNLGNLTEPEKIRARQLIKELQEKQAELKTLLPK